MVGEMCVLVNRTSAPLEAKQNGRILILQPGPNPATTDWIRFAKLQNPRMGTFDESGMNGEYLIGVQDVDDCSMIPPGEERKNNSVELFDRSLFEGEGAQAEVVQTGVRPPIRRVPSEMTGVPENAIFNGRQ